KSLDRESAPLHTLDVTASDLGSPTLSSVATVKITVQDVNDNPPIFVDSSYQVSLSEDTSAGVSLVTVSAEDADEGSNADLRFSLVDDNGYFLIDPFTGTIRLAKPLDYE
ncbi:hypothetical protein CAPTEDRAFT_79489, partial [Capitella teleta]